jgi:alpha-L-fucosidase 2
MKNWYNHSKPTLPGVAIGVLFLISFLAIESFLPASGQKPADISKSLDSYNVSWNVPGHGSAESMPIGNGDIGLNVWVETNGDLNFYISKTDAWSENIRGTWGLLKLGRVVVSLDPRPVVSPFLQVLKLRTGEIVVKESNTNYRIWVDANNPVIHVEAQCKKPVSMTVRSKDFENGKMAFSSLS